MVQPKHGTEFLYIGTDFRAVQDWVLKVSLRADFGYKTATNAGIFVVNYFSEQFSG